MSGGRVYWESDPTRTRDVVGYCKTCDHIEPIRRPVYLVSPCGISHHADSERTLCGKDATGPGWWWRT